MNKATLSAAVLAFAANTASAAQDCRDPGGPKDPEIKEISKKCVEVEKCTEIKVCF